MRPLLALFAIVWFAAGCASAPPIARTPFLNSVDLVEMTDQMAQSFAGDAVIGQRNADDDHWIISLYRVVNHTNQIIPEREKWLYVGRLRAVLDRSDLSSQRNVTWIVPPNRWRQISELEGGAIDPGPRLDPTHLLTAQFSALTQTSGAGGVSRQAMQKGGGGRSDTYLCSYELLDLESGRIIWEDAWEVKRSTRGITYD